MVKGVEEAKRLRNCIGKNIKRIREQKNISRNDLAQKVGIDPRSLGKIERGEQYPKIHNFISIYSCLEIPANALMTNNYSLESKQKSSTFEEILSILNSLKDENLIFVHKLLSLMSSENRL